MQQAGWHMDLTRTSGFLIPQTLISLQKCTLTVWALGPGPHDPPVQQEEARAVSAPFPNDSGPHVAREDRQVVRHEQGIRGQRFGPLIRGGNTESCPGAQVWGLAPRPQKQSPEPKSPRKLTVPLYNCCQKPPAAAAAAAKSLQSCLTLCDPTDSSPPGSPVPGILQARTLDWVVISFSNAWKWKVKGKSLSHVRLLATPWTAAHQAPPSMGFSSQEYWSGVPLPSPQWRYMSI